MNRYGKEVLQALLRESAHSTFGKYISSTIKDIIYDAFPEKVSYRYRVPPALCQQEVSPSPSTDKKYVFTAGALLAVFDELSTYPITLEDKTYRAGVSVDLFTEILKPAYANEEVYIVTRTDKIGKTLGFCTMEMLNLQGDLLARGKHVKYLPLGAHLDLIAKSPFFPLIIKLYYTFRVKAFQSPLDKVFGISNQEVPLADDILQEGYVFNTLLPVRVHDNDVDRKAILIDAPDNHHCDDAELYTMRVSRALKQFIGNLHGGALGATIEQASKMFKISRQKDLESVLILKSLDIRYLAPMRGELLIKVGDDKFSELLHTSDGKLETRSKSVGYIYNQKNHSVCAEFTCEWKL